MKQQSPITAQIRAAQLVAGNIARQKRLHNTTYETRAEVINVSKGTMSNRMHNPSTFTLMELLLLARFFRIEIQELICG